MKLCIVPRWGGTLESDYYPWLQARPEVRARFDQVLGPNIDDPGTPTIDAWMASLTRAVAPETLADTYFLGHSVGCQAVLRFLAAGPAGARAAGVLCVAGWWTVDEPWDTIRPWIDTPFEIERARAACGRVITLISDNDPFTADWRTNQQLWEERLGAEVRVIPGAKHFNGSEEPAVLDAVCALAGA